MNNYEAYLNYTQNQLLKAIEHLEYSFHKVTHLPTDPAQLNEETLETWESFTTRFSRVVDLFLIKYLKAYIKINDPGFEGSLRDFLNFGEKLGIIDDAKSWLTLRSLRNITAHEYTDENLESFLIQMKEECHRLLDLKNKINKKSLT